MSVRQVRVEGAQEIIRMLDALPGEVRKAARTSLNRQATATRKDDIVEKLMAATGLQRKILNDRLPISRANQNLIAIIRANQNGIPVPAYIWSHQFAGRYGRGYNPTRHRIIVKWPGGSKIAAGFVNPFGTYKAPLTTRLRNVRLGIALAPSAASLRKQVYRDAEMGVTAEQLAQRFNDFLADIVRQRPIPDD